MTNAWDTFAKELEAQADRLAVGHPSGQAVAAQEIYGCAVTCETTHRKEHTE